MAIYDVLKDVQDVRVSSNGECEFNGFLEDYLSLLETDESKKEEYEVLSAIFEEDQNLRIVVNLKLSINKSVVANQIIRYKDAFKLPEGTICCPYIVYGQFQDQQKAILLVYGDKEAYILAKGLYYVISEPENKYEGTRNEIVAMSIHEDCVDDRLERLRAFFFRGKKAGIIQRDLDGQVFGNYEAMYKLAKDMAVYQKDYVRDILESSQDYEASIYQMIVKWFLLKKFTYVQYMMDKTTLHTIHEENVKRQRQVAKEKSDEICFISFTELWKLTKEL